MIRETQALSLAQLQEIVPSAFAVQPHESRSSRYAFIPTSDVIQGMIDAGFVPVAAKQSKSRIAGKENFTKHMIRFRSVAQGLATEDSQVEAVMINSHDGTSRYKLMAGIFRMICENGLIVADSLLHAINVMHAGNIISEVVEGAHFIFDNAHKVIEASENWKQIELQPVEQKLLAESAHELRFPRDEEGKTTSPVTPEMLLNARRHDDEGHDLWRTFNRIQENATQGFRRWISGGFQEDGSYRRGRRVTARSIRNIDGDVKLNRALWSLAEKMAELKKSA
jgi:hypothetical protein